MKRKQISSISLIKWDTGSGRWLLEPGFVEKVRVVIGKKARGSVLIAEQQGTQEDVLRVWLG